MEHNIGATDRTVRLLVGGLLALLGLGILAGMLAVSQLVGVLALVVGLVFVGTALLRTCLLYRLLGLDTARST